MPPPQTNKQIDKQMGWNILGFERGVLEGPGYAAARTSGWRILEKQTPSSLAIFVLAKLKGD